MKNILYMINLIVKEIFVSGKEVVKEKTDNISVKLTKEQYEKVLKIIESKEK